MRSKLLVSTAVLVASVAIASAQTPGGSQERRTPGASEHGQLQQAPAGQQRAQGTEQRPGQQSRPQAQGQRDLTTGQAPQNQRTPNPSQQRVDEHEGNQGAKPQSGQAGDLNKREESGQRQNNQTTGQNNQTGENRTRQDNETGRNNRSGENNQTGQNQREQGQAQQQQGLREGNQNFGQGREQQGQFGAREGQAGGREGAVTLNTQQRETIRNYVSSTPNVPRVDRADFALDVGTVVPERVVIAPVPEVLVQDYPQFRGDYYFVMREDVVVVGPDHRIIAMVPLGLARAENENRGFAFNGSPAEIREIQTMLIRDGYNIGAPDGVMGPRTKEALMMFQRQHGMRATGEIDEQTFAALRGGREEGQRGTAGNPPSTTGQAGQGNTRQPGGNFEERRDNGRQPSDNREPSTNQRQGASNPGQPATTGQGPGNNRNQPGGNFGNGANPSANSPQAGEPSRQKGDQQR